MTHNKKGAEISAIEFALRADDGIEFLRAWHEGSFDVVRREWPDAPEAVFVGADPLHKPKAPEQGEPIAKAYLHYPPKKPELSVLSFRKEPSVSEKARGFISEPLFTHPAPKAEPVNQMLLDIAYEVANAMPVNASQHIVRIGTVESARAAIAAAEEAK